MAPLPLVNQLHINELKWKKVIKVNTSSMVAIAITAAVILSAQNSEKDLILSRSVSYTEDGPLSIRRNFVLTLKGAGLPGGIELFDDCSTELIKVDTHQGWSVADVLNSLVAVRPNLTFNISKSGGVYLHPKGPHSSILGVQLHEFTLGDARKFVGAIDQILHSPEVQERMKTLGISASRVEPGFTSLKKPGSTADAPRPVRFTKLTVREVLSRLAELSGTAIWVYNEHSCSGQTTFDLNFDVR